MCKCIFCTNPTHIWVIIYDHIFEGEYEEALAKINAMGVVSTTEKEIAHNMANAILRQEMILPENEFAKELISKLHMWVVGVSVP